MPATFLRKAWEDFIKSFKVEMSEQEADIERALAFARMREQLWTLLEQTTQESGEWAWPLDIFIDDDGSLFSIVAQSGKLYQVPVTVKGEEMSLGSWQQVTEVFKPVEQTSFRIIRDKKTGIHRWVGIVATSVLNRVAEIDSRELFDSFIEDVAETGDWPTVDFYHLGRSNEDAWEFGKADYHCREDFCYVMSGTFDESHPLAQATIRAYEEDPQKWGFSIEFFAFGEPEVIVVEPEVRVPVYKKGRIIRVSIVKEQDAASLFTRVANITEEKVRMKRDTMSALADLFGSDDAAKKFLEQFEVNVDQINRSVTDENLVHRTKETKEEPKAREAEAEEAAAEEGEEPILEISDEDIDAISDQLMSSPQFQAIGQALVKIQSTLDSLSKAREADAKEIETLKAANASATKRLATVEKTEEVKKSEYLQDLPARTVRKANYRPREQYAPETEETQEEDLSARAERTLARIPTRY